MKASEMTSEELAKNLGYAVYNLTPYTAELVREAAARLRLKQQSDNYAAALHRQEAEYKREICDLRRRLKAAEDALERIASNDCICESDLYAKEALAAIREETGGRRVQ